MTLLYLPCLKLLHWFYISSMILLTFFYTPTSQKPLISFPWFWSESMFHNHIIMLTIYNTAILFSILVFLDLSSLDISWNALFANAILRVTSFLLLPSAVFLFLLILLYLIILTIDFLCLIYILILLTTPLCCRWK